MLPKPRPLPISPKLVPSGQAAPELYWIGTSTVHSCLWPRSDGDAVRGSPLNPFVESVLEATSRIWILDAHFDGAGGYAVLQAAFDLLQQEAREQSVRLTCVSSAGATARWKRG